jgi:homoserine kinase
VRTPSGGTKTTAPTRGLLPPSVPHADAAANAGRAALLVAALASRPEHLFAATRDWLHQDQRAEAMPTSLALMERLRQRGIPAVVSGAGPTVLAFTGTSQTRAARDVAGHAPRGWAVHRLDVEPQGAVLL